MSSRPTIRKVTTGHQITLPQSFREDNNIEIGSSVSITDEGDKLVIKPFKDRTKALQQLKELWKHTPKEFAHMSEEEIMEMVNEEIKAARREG